MSDGGPLEQFVVDAVRAEMGSNAVQIPGIVVSYDRATQTAKVRPWVMARQHDPDTDELTPLVLPIQANVPVMFPSGGGCSITFDLSVGDPVILQMCDRSIDEWKAQQGSPPVAPVNTRRFDLSDAVAYPGTRPIADALPADAWAAGAMVLNADLLLLLTATANDPVGTENRILAKLNELIGVFNNHTHVYTPGSLAAVVTAPPVGQQAVVVVGDLGSPNVKAP